MNATLTSISQSLNSSGPHVGDILWWSLFDSHVSAEWFAGEWKAAGLDGSILAQPKTPARALREAGFAAVTGVDGQLFRFAAQTDERTIWALVREERKGDGSVEYHQEAQIAVDLAAGTFSSDCAAHPIVQDIRARYDALVGTYSSREVRASIVRLLERSSAVSIREAGGVYWIPAPYAETGRRLKAVIDQVGSSVFSVLPVHETNIGNEALGNAARGSLETEIVELKDEIARFKADPPKAATLERRLEAFTALQARASLYRDLLSVEVSDLETNLTELADSVKAIIGGLEKAAA
jgi:uncharacterized protein involved in exopolysaccharide biosynthesis